MRLPRTVKSIGPEQVAFLGVRRALQRQIHEHPPAPLDLQDGWINSRDAVDENIDLFPDLRESPRAVEIDNDWPPPTGKS